MSTEREYRKTGTVYARKVEGTETVKVYSLEGPAVAKPGDYILRSTDGGEEWVVAVDRFEATYQPIGETAPVYREASNRNGLLFQHTCGRVKAFNRPPSSGECGVGDIRCEYESAEAGSWQPLYRADSRPGTAR